jgi:hypothetical protein
MVEFSRSRPHRLVAQDVALSRPKHQFEPGWGHLPGSAKHTFKQTKTAVQAPEGEFAQQRWHPSQ